MYSKADHERIHEAIAAAEQRTSGEVFCIVAEEAGRYAEVPFAWAAAVALLAPPAALVVGVRPTGLADLVQRLQNNGWEIGHAGAVNAALLAALIGYAVIQLILFGAAYAVFSIPAVRRFATPGRLKTDHVHAKAVEQFAHRLHAATARTGVLIFASLAERRVEVIADEDIHAKVGDAVWDKAVAEALAHIKTGDVAGGLVLAVGICGDALAANFPPDGTGPARGDVAEL
jgi:putative membrane protein